MIPTSVIAWEGPSLITGDLVQVVLTGLVRPSNNIKTGPMVQCSVRVAGKHPLDIINTTLERAICGDCEHRGDKATGKKRDCYVNCKMLMHLGHDFPKVSLAEAADLVSYGRGLRLGAYAELTAVPFTITETLAAAARFWTGYTSNWENCDPRFSKYFMASVSSRAARAKAKLKGFKTYRIRKDPNEVPEKGEMVCPYETSGIQCVECKRCDGMASRGPDQLITFHGPGHPKRRPLKIAA